MRAAPLKGGLHAVNRCYLIIIIIIVIVIVIIVVVIVIVIIIIIIFVLLKSRNTTRVNSSGGTEIGVVKEGLVVND